MRSWRPPMLWTALKAAGNISRNMHKHLESRLGVCDERKRDFEVWLKFARARAKRLSRLYAWLSGRQHVQTSMLTMLKSWSGEGSRRRRLTRNTLGSVGGQRQSIVASSLHLLPRLLWECLCLRTTCIFSMPIQQGPVKVHWIGHRKEEHNPRGVAIMVRLATYCTRKDPVPCGNKVGMHELCEIKMLNDTC